MNFIDLCINNKSSVEDIDDFIDDWHEGSSPQALHTFLGMRWEEYAHWIADPKRLADIIEARKES